MKLKYSTALTADSKVSILIDYSLPVLSHTSIPALILFYSISLGHHGLHCSLLDVHRVGGGARYLRISGVLEVELKKPSLKESWSLRV